MNFGLLLLQPEGQQEGGFEVFAGAKREGVVPVFGTGEAAEGGFGGDVWVLIPCVCVFGMVDSKHFY